MERPSASEQRAIIADRFELMAPAGSGGMGVVYRAHDRLTDRTVALKLVSGPGSDHERFMREASLLAELVHPAIVDYVAHGLSPSGDRWLAMEWLDGEDLAVRLRRGALTIEDALAVGRRIAWALAHAHARGVVHRDVKPSNIFLVDGDVARAKLLDFGVARDGARLTCTGAQIGTPAYMAPEQARGDRAVDVRVDVFALGCVLFECVIGQPAFGGESAMAVLAKVVFEEAPRAGELQPGLPAELDHLLATLLAKDPTHRPANGAAVAQLIDELRVGDRAVRPSEVEPSHRHTEKRSVLVIVVNAGPVESAERVRTVLRASWGAEVVQLADGTFALVWSGTGEARDMATRAAHCALEVIRLVSSAKIALAAGQVERSRGGIAGEVIDRAAGLANLSSGAIALDRAVAALLEGRFRIDGECHLVSALDSEEERRLLARPTPFVGRDTELSMLMSLVEDALSDETTRIALVTAPPGTGKSRLAREVMARLRARGIQVVRARGDVMRVGAPFGIASQLVRSACNASHGTDSVGARLDAHLEAVIEPSDVVHATEFIGEILDVTLHRPPSPELRAARSDPRLMAEQVRTAISRWLRAECKKPFGMILDDLQWGDAASMRVLDAAFDRLRDVPLFVLAFARPEIEHVFPQLWATRQVHRLPLAPLSRKASERLVRAVLGDAVAPHVIAHVTDRAAGNAFVLEEFVRAVAEGRDRELPESVRAIVHARLEALPPAVRRTLCAASVFGGTFARQDIAQLVGRDSDAHLDELVRLELCEATADRRDELEFRHELVREAAYRMLGDAELRALHLRCAEWFEATRTRDRLAIAEHFRAAGEVDRARPHYIEAAERAVFGDARQALAIVARGFETGPSDIERGALCSIECIAHAFCGELHAALRSSSEALVLLPANDGRWFRAAGAALTLHGTSGNLERTDEIARMIEAASLDGGVTTAHIQALAIAGHGLCRLGQTQRARSLLGRARMAVPVDTDLDPAGVGAVEGLALFIAYYGGSDPWAWATHGSRAVELMKRAGDAMWAAYSHAWTAFARCWSGDPVAAIADLSTLRRGNTSALVTNVIDLFQGIALSCAGSYDDAAKFLSAAAAGADRGTDLSVSGHALAALAECELARGDLTSAAAHALSAIERLSIIPGNRAYALSILARAKLESGDLEHARDASDRAWQLASMMELQQPFGACARLARMQTLAALGQRDAARDAAAEACSWLTTHASHAPDEAERVRFLALPVNSQLLDLARRF